MSIQSLEERAVNTIRTLSIDAVQAAESGHPGMPMGMADAAYVLWTKFLKHDPGHPDWYNRDRFILSAGHGSMLLYSLLYLTGYDITLDNLKNFRQWNSITPGHPEFGLTPGVETTTGPLGQGFATGVGMAVAEAHLAKKFNTDEHRITDHYTYGIVSDGDLMEGISHEAASLAGHLKLNKIIYLYDANDISIDGSTELAYTEDAQKRFISYGWHVQEIDGHDRKAVEKSIGKAQNASEQPSLIICRTHIGYGSPNKQDSAASHGAPLGEEEVRLSKENLGCDPDKHFFVADDVLAHFRTAKKEGIKQYENWKGKVEQFGTSFPEKEKQFRQQIGRSLPDNLAELIPVFDADENGIATRSASGTVINALAAEIPAMVGGSADLTGSNKTWINDAEILDHQNYAGRNIHFGVREHAMAAAMNGMSLHGGIIPFGGTFLIFSDYCRPAIRIAALSHIPSIFVLTHDSIGLGEDGPTHQPIEHLMSLRAMPNVLMLRPADANEVAWAWKAALENVDGPSLIALTRQSVPVFDRSECSPASGVMKGAYVLADSASENPDAILMASGSEVQIMMEARKVLKNKGINVRVVSMPSWELFEQQDEKYRDEVLPASVEVRVSVEAGATLGWERYIGDNGTAIGLNHFGASAPYEKIYEAFGLTSERVVREIMKLLS